MIFDITSAMIKLLNLKGVFTRVATDDGNMQLANLTRICTSYIIPGVDQEELRLWLFPLSMIGETLLWLG